MDDQEWQAFWDRFDVEVDEAEERFQAENTKTHGSAHYYMHPDELWKVQQKIIRRLVEAKLKEKNGC